MAKTMAKLTLKTAALIILFVATVLGCHAHFDNPVIWKIWDTPGFAEICKGLEGCSNSELQMEKAFVGLTISILALSALSIVIGFWMESPKIKNVDTFYHIFAGICITIAGCLMIIAAVKLDDFIIKGQLGPRALNPMDDLKTEIRKEMRYLNKIAAGALALTDGLLYFSIAPIILKY